MNSARAILRRYVPEALQERIRARTTYQRLRHEDSPWSLAPFERHQAIFIHIPKTGGISIKKALFGLTAGRHISALTFRRVYGPQLFNAFYKFAFVRNPWDRLVSAYFFLQKGGMHSDDQYFAAKHLAKLDTFERFVHEGLERRAILQWVHFRPQSDWVTIDGQLATDFIGRLETIEQDYEVVRTRLGIGDALPKANQSKHKDYRTYFTPEMVDIVANVYRSDIERFGYTFE